jgi:hypothetical protein
VVPQNLAPIESQISHCFCNVNIKYRHSVSASCAYIVYIISVTTKSSFILEIPLLFELSQSKFSAQFCNFQKFYSWGLRHESHFAIVIRLEHLCTSRCDIFFIWSIEMLDMYRSKTSDQSFQPLIEVIWWLIWEVLHVTKSERCGISPYPTYSYIPLMLS